MTMVTAENNTKINMNVIGCIRQTIVFQMVKKDEIDEWKQAENKTFDIWNLISAANDSVKNTIKRQRHTIEWNGQQNEICPFDICAKNTEKNAKEK